MTNKKRGIFCLEGDWWGVRDKTSVEPLLRLLETMGDCKVPYFHHDVATHDELDFYLNKAWQVFREPPDSVPERSTANPAASRSARDGTTRSPSMTWRSGSRVLASGA